METIRERYRDAVYKEVTLPFAGWQEYDGLTEELGTMYGKIYEDGPLTYEIEAFRDDGSCHLMITREK